jgi:hypothetical protein
MRMVVIGAGIIGARLARTGGFLLPAACARVSGMGNQSYMKRQKELARQQKQRDKFARRLQRRAEKVKGGPPLETENPNLPKGPEPQSQK